MTRKPPINRVTKLACVLWASVATTFFEPNSALAQSTAFRQAIAEHAASDRALATFFQEHDYQRFWTVQGEIGTKRRAALFRAIEGAELHGLPAARYDTQNVMQQLEAAKSPRDLGQIEVAMSGLLLDYARDLKTGVLVPGAVDGSIKRERPSFDQKAVLAAFASGNPNALITELAPDSNEYRRLMKEKLRLENLIQMGGWGPAVQAEKLEEGDAGNTVIALRNRLMSMEYLERHVGVVYDQKIKQAVQAFQLANGLEPDGVAGPSTLAELNKSVEDRLKSIIVAMERERWISQPRNERHIRVNLTDFHARVYENDEVQFETRAVVGKNGDDRRSPEFSDEMEFMVINPTWHVPRSIAVKEYLPKLKRNRNAVSHLKIYNRQGRVVNRGAINFAAFNKRNFPFAIKQPPSEKNALGLVKFMFPNKYNIYLHDTPAKDLFAREKRDFSHGCIRLQKPFGFAYEMLSKQENDPKAFFHRKLDTGKETKVLLDQKVPVHIIYRTAFTLPKEGVQFRSDVYGRDAKIWDALSKAGVSLGAVQG
ncbi:murein L,D-transpeptidase [Roseovarius albus]|uniref:Murein L,D-transpeptidase n=1 Tax=Roseovarius albus TaxID=1247867 RepID=A0A1X6YZU9_9RHOB|nr:L,D-transpeptidase family protein [Roseovarius albus]SLN36006.1 murein L,D-transpeptidase [Roseovarius albus]